MTRYISFLKYAWIFLLTSKYLRIVRYGIVGLTNAGVCVTFMYLGYLAGLHYLEYTILGYFISILFSFYMNLRFTFRVSGNIKKRLVLFFVISLSNLAMVEMIEYIMIDIYKFQPMVAIICGILWYAVIGFIINTLWIYRHSMD